MSLDALLAFAPALPGMPREFVPWCAWAGVPLTPGQARLARVAFDHKQPDPKNEMDRVLFGETCATVPATAHRFVVMRLGRGSGKSHMCAAYGVFRMLVGDVSECGPGDYPAVGFVSTKEREAKRNVSKAIAIARKHPAIRALVQDPTVTGFSIKRPDGAIVKFETRVAKAKGEDTRGPSWLLFVIDEAEFIDPSKSDSAERVQEMVHGARPRMGRGGAVVLCSTPWPAESVVSKAFDANFGKPTYAICAFGPTLMLHDTPTLREERDVMLATDTAQALREFDCIVTDVSGAFFEASTIDDAVAKTTPRSRFQNVSVGIDLAFINDMAGAVHVERQIVGAMAKVVVTSLDLTDPRKHPEDRKPNSVVARFVHAAREAGAGELVADGHFAPLVREHAANPDVAMQVVAAPTTPADQSAAELYLRDLFREGLILIPNDPRLVGQLKSVLTKAQPGGLIRAMPPRRTGVGHCDLFVALRNAVWHDRRHGPLLRGNAVATGANTGGGPTAMGTSFATDEWT